MPVTNYISVNGRMLSEVTDGVILDYVPDALGSIHSVVDQTATAVKTMRYKPYGEVLSRSGSISDRMYQWVGTYGYRATFNYASSHYVRARHYSQTPGTWTTVDPLWPEENKYTYVEGRAIYAIDPSGAYRVIPPRLLFPPAPNYSPGTGYTPRWARNPGDGRPIVNPALEPFDPAFPPPWALPPRRRVVIPSDRPIPCIAPGGTDYVHPDVSDYLECVDLNRRYHEVCDGPGPVRGCGPGKKIKKEDCNSMAIGIDAFLNGCIVDRLRVLECDRTKPPGWLPNPNGHLKQMCAQLRRLMKCLNNYRDSCGKGALPPSFDKLIGILDKRCNDAGF